VLVLEAGPADRHPYIKVPAAFPKLFGSRIDWADRTEPQPALGGRRIFFPRGRVLGGSSSINAMMWVRGTAADFAAWERVAGPGWAWQAVLPYFRRAERTDRRVSGHAETLGRDGPLSISLPRELNPLTRAWLEAARSLGMAELAQNADARDGVAPTLLTQRHGRRQSAADAYLRPAMRRANLLVRTGALVERVAFEGRRAVGVAYLHGRRRRFAAARAEVLLAAGAVGSPTILQRSGVGPSAVLSELGIATVIDLPGIGSNLQDHLVSGLVVESRSQQTLAAAQSPRELWRFARSRRGLLTSNVAEGYGYLRSDPALSDPDLELIFAPVAFLAEGLVVPRVHGVTCAAVLLQPESRGTVRIRSADPREPPRIDPRYLSDPAGADAARLAVGVRWCIRVLSRPPLASLTGATIQPAGAAGEDVVQASLRDCAQTLYHPVGTCAMGLAAGCVLDPELRVRGVGNLRVADASAIPLLGRGHTNAPTIMLAERASDLLRLGRAG
jgi:choline dehydrogenase